MTTVRRSRRVEPVIHTADETLHITSMYGGDERADNRVIEVRKFPVEPAYVRVSTGMTQNMGNYESLRVEVSITLPCVVEEVDDALIVAADKVSQFLSEEMQRYNDARS